MSYIEAHDLANRVLNCQSYDEFKQKTKLYLTDPQTYGIWVQNYDKVKEFVKNIQSLESNAATLIYDALAPKDFGKVFTDSSMTFESDVFTFTNIEANTTYQIYINVDNLILILSLLFQNMKLTWDAGQKCAKKWNPIYIRTLSNQFGDINY